MDFLSHLFLPLTAVYVVRRDLFTSSWMVGIAGFGLLSDFDKFLGMPGVLHSLVTLGPIALAILGLEYWVRGQLRVSPVIGALLVSHLLLDFIDGGPVPLLFPLIETGIGVQYPAQTVFAGPLGVYLDGPLVALRTAAPRPDSNRYGFITGEGVASMLLFGIVYASDRWHMWRRPSSGTTSTGSRAPRRSDDPSADEPRDATHPPRP